MPQGNLSVQPATWKWREFNEGHVDIHCNGALIQSHGVHAYMRKTSSVADTAIWAKKMRKIWPKNGLKLPKIA